MINKRWVEYRYVICNQTLPVSREWRLAERSVMNAEFQPGGGRLDEGAVTKGLLIAYVLVNCDVEGVPLSLDGHDNLADCMFKQCLPGARLM